MRIFTVKKTSSHLLRKAIASAAIFFCCAVLLLFGVSSISDSASRNQAENLRQALTRSAVHCYAMEGRYPESLDYLQEHYGIHWDSERYVVDYEIIGSNLKPRITVIPLQGS